MAVVDELLAIGEEDRRKKQFLQDNPLFGMEPYHEVRPTYSNRYTEAVGSLLEPLMTRPDAGPLDINFWTGLLSTPLVKSMRPREEPTKMEYAFSGVPFTPGLGVAPSLGRAAAKRFIPEFDPSRRQFLKTSATVGALTGLGIPLAKKALTKTTGAIEGLAATISNDVRGLGIEDALYKVSDYFNNVSRTWLGSLKNVKARADEVQGDLVARSGDSLYDDLDSLEIMDEHLGTDAFDPQYGESATGQVFDDTGTYGYGEATEGVIHRAYIDSHKWIDNLDADTISKEYSEMYQAHLADDDVRGLGSATGDALDSARAQMIFDEQQALYSHADGVVGVSGELNSVLGRLSYLERTDPQLLIKLIDEEIKEVSTRIKRLSPPEVRIEYNSLIYDESVETLGKLKELKDQIADTLKPPKPKKKDDVSIVQRVLDPLGYTRMKAPYEK